MDRFAANIELTYLVRIFAEFEAALRDVWRLHFKRPSAPPVSALIDSIGAKCGVPDADILEVHQVREYRNSVVHEGVVSSFKLSLGESRNRLCKFMARLPLTW